MHRQKLLAGVLLAVGPFLCGAASVNLENGLLRRSDDLDEHMKRDAYNVVENKLHKRQFTRTAPFPSGPPPTDVPLPDFAALTATSTPTATAVSAPAVTPASGNASAFDPNAWEAQTAAQCQSAMQKLNGQASNPSGLAVCYNLPFLDNQTGVFEAELRMFNLSAPIDPWTGITTQEMQVTLSYLGAMVQSANNTVFKRDEDGVLMDEILVERQSAMMPVVIKRYVGKINSNLMGSASTADDLKQFLVPQIDLSAMNPDSKQAINTTLSSTEASFVSGIFAQQATTTNTAEAAASASAFAATASIFVLPGVDLGIFPVGLIVTLIWTVGFFVVVGLGTLGRVQFRDQYRRNVKRQQASGFKTI